MRNLFIALIIWCAKRTPYFHLEGYMDRWWLVRPRSWLPFSIRVHHIKRADDDRHLHDHPWAFKTLIMSGCYLEELPVSQGQPGADDVFWNITNLRCENEIVSHRAIDRHKIVNVSPGGVWTLFIMGRRTNPWGFYTAEGKIGWREYLNDYTTKVEGE
jgi:hypothetical protein